MIKIDVGSGLTPWGTEKSTKCDSEQDWIHIDIAAFPHVDIIASMLKLPFPDSNIDIINCHHALEHIWWFETEKAIKEFNRILKVGGELHLTIPSQELARYHYELFRKSPSPDYPDIDEYCQRLIYLMPDDREGEHHSCWSSRWYQITLIKYGFDIYKKLDRPEDMVTSEMSFFCKKIS